VPYFLGHPVYSRCGWLTNKAKWLEALSQQLSTTQDDAVLSTRTKTELQQFAISYSIYLKQTTKVLPAVFTGFYYVLIIITYYYYCCIIIVIIIVYWVNESDNE